MRRGRLGPLLALAALIFAGEAAGCRDILGVERREVGDRDATETWIAGLCGDCVASSCADLADECGRDAGCRTLTECMLASPDDPIGRMACLEADRVTVGASAFVELDACLRSTCQAA